MTANNDIFLEQPLGTREHSSNAVGQQPRAEQPPLQLQQQQQQRHELEQQYSAYPQYPGYSVSMPQAMGYPPSSNHLPPQQSYQYIPPMATPYPSNQPGTFHSDVNTPASNYCPTSPQPTAYTSEKPSTSGPSANSHHHNHVSSAIKEGSANSLLNCLKDSVKSVQITDVIPAVTMLSAAILHHTKHRRSDTLIPYQKSHWFKRLNNALFAYNAYAFAKDNGFIKSRSRDISQPSTQMADTRELSNSNSGSTLLQQIAGSLFLQSNESNDGNLVSQFDDRWAVPKPTAEHYYNLIYHTKTSLYNASIQMLGAAAAIQALRSGNHHISASENPGYKAEHSLMGFALSEVSYLLERKEEAGYLHPNDTLENVGKIALATLIKIKIDQERKYYT
ncbi:hypothetical protein IWW36_002125 [Coemansia brasiliensis]|uniref:Uncharacterized protein n=1 Tax=Coemansia brasiliensis TaxID=2650707 RepID=A0A9W8I7R4_9FUNG|nr:hypothetical protein IWW36_002125 [Coemansia brasiliensis]